MAGNTSLHMRRLVIVVALSGKHFFTSYSIVDSELRS